MWKGGRRQVSFTSAVRSCALVSIRCFRDPAASLPPPELLLVGEALQQGCCSWVVNLGLPKDAPRQLQVRLQHLQVTMAAEQKSRRGGLAACGRVLQL